MKLLSLILALSITLLALIPCAETSSCADEKECQESRSNSCDASSEHETGDFCTPFCVMSCCISGIVISADQYNFTLPDLQIHIDFPSLENSPGAFFSHSIWQPPKSLC